MFDISQKKSRNLDMTTKQGNAFHYSYKKMEERTFKAKFVFLSLCSGCKRVKKFF